MANDIGNYARHAQYWDWSGHDRTAEDEYWYNYAKRYGNNILIPMCALGESGAYMAERGMNATAFDITPEMIAEGKKRFGYIKGLNLFEGDVRDFRFDIPPADFCYSTDFGHILSIEDIKKALVCINNHLREGGCLVIETGLRMPNAESSYTPKQTFYPFKQIYPDMKVWKTGETRNEADTGRSCISQTFFAEDKNGTVESFEHSFYLQSYSRDEWLAAFLECGFDVVGEYSSREVESWLSGGAGFRIFEAVKMAPESKLNLQHSKIDIDADRNYLLERHCRVNYESGTPWTRKISYEEYQADCFKDGNQNWMEEFLSSLRESMEDPRTIAEIIKTEANETVGYLWVLFHAEDASYFWADVSDIYVEEAFRKKGIATYLMDYAEHMAKRNGAKVIRSGTGCENFKSQGLHHKIGYYQSWVQYEKILLEEQ